MFRKIVLATLAAAGLMTAAVAPLQAHPHYRHETHRVARYEVRGHYRPYQSRAFSCWAEANGWMTYQRQHGYECYYQWNGPQCVIYYR